MIDFMASWGVSRGQNVLVCDGTQCWKWGDKLKVVAMHIEDKLKELELSI